MKIYLVGGIIRDRLLGLQSDDYDYVMVLDNIDTVKSVEAGFVMMRQYMLKEGYKLFLQTPEMYTIRAKFPAGHVNEGLTADFVLARKEVGYVEGTRRPILELGTLADDLARRDFTINAMAEDENGEIIDLFGGKRDLEERVLRTPISPKITMLDDPLRLIRAIRFSIVKGLSIDYSIINAINDNPGIFEKLVKVVSQDRIREELNKMFMFDTTKTLQQLSLCNGVFNGKLYPALFRGNYRLEMTSRLVPKKL